MRFIEVPPPEWKPTVDGDQEAIEVGKRVLKEISPTSGRVYVSSELTFKDLERLQGILSVLKEVRMEKKWLQVAPDWIGVKFTDISPVLRFVPAKRVVKIYAWWRVYYWCEWRGRQIGSIPHKKFTSKTLLEFLKVAEERYDKKSWEQHRRYVDYREEKRRKLEELANQLPRRIWGSTLAKLAGEIGDLFSILSYQVGVEWNEKERAYDIRIAVWGAKPAAVSYYTVKEIKGFKEIVEKIRREENEA